ncbi:amino acid adenylation domain-containing protein [Tissierella carlieri]|uniref:Amino acid adenylation domain-containing protein n=1 Tax=Tissierella carlieri TaxID=689904 RepID=A0ABT1S5B1_9FIRM|nr:non-ribosomal peptide synthetase [Tissierella carlieri]MCQ4921644.1 amino acid adenylation domain-containing protein [Tissierella carlieri]
MNEIQLNIILSSFSYPEMKKYWMNTLDHDIYIYDESFHFYDDNTDKGYKRMGFEFDHAYSAKLVENSEDEESVFAWLMTCMSALLYRYISNKRLYITTPIYEDLRSNDTLNNRVLFSPRINGDEESFSSLYFQIKQLEHDVYFNQHYPIDKIVENLNWNIQGKDLLRVGCEYNGIHKPFSVEEEQFNIIFSFEREDNIVKGEIIYREALFSETQIKDIYNSFANLLNEMLENPHVLICNASMVDDDSRYRYMQYINNSSADYDVEKTVVELFEEQLINNKYNIAIEEDGRQYSYYELYQRSNNIARELKNRNVMFGDTIGIKSENNVDAIASIIGIMKMGGNYLPLDGSNPLQRITKILKKSNVKTVLTDTSLEKLDIEIDVVNFNEIAQANEEVIGNESRWNSAAYVIYTSGSSGEPKGVKVLHKNLTNYVVWAAKQYNNGKPCNMPLFTSLAFDLTATSIFLPLITGGQILINNKGDKANAICRIVEEDKVNLIKLTPVHLEILARTNSYSEKIQSFIVGGEELKREAVERIRNKFDGVEIYNEYGPTEATIGCMVHRYDPERDKQSTVPIGRAAHNTRIYLLDEKLRLVAPGVEGEIYIAGGGVTSGYVDNEQETIKHFLPDILNENEVMYKTGDIGKWSTDGPIEYLGRKDNQIKIRGYRVETGEIENLLMKYDGIRQAVVVDKERKSGDKILCAYIECGSDKDDEGIMEYLKSNLADYMLPAYIQRVDNLPVTANGKIDRRFLQNMELEEEYDLKKEQPKNEMEQILMDIWQEVLEHSDFGVNDSFFEVGGNSFSAIYASSKINSQFNIETDFQDFFMYSTIRTFAKVLKSKRKPKSEIIPKAEVKDHYKASSGQKRMYALNYLTGESTTYNCPYAYQIKGAFNEDIFYDCYCKLLEKHDSLRTSFVIQDGEVIQTIHSNVTPDYSFIDYMKMSNNYDKIEHLEEVVKSIIADFVKPFRLQKAPLFRMKVIKISNDLFIMMVDIHHIICDAVSMSILLQDFADLINGKQLQKPLYQYYDYSEWQNSLIENGKLEKQERFWLELFKNEIPVLNMPTDFSRPPKQTFKGNTITRNMDHLLTEQLCDLARKYNCTLYMVIMSIYSIVLHKYSGQDDFIIGTAVAGRQETELYDIVGLFINTLPMRVGVNYNNTFEEHLHQVKEMAIQAFSNQDYQIEELIKNIKVPVDVSRNALYSTMFTMQNAKMTKQVENLDITPLNIPLDISRVDINIMATETEQGIEFVLQFCDDLFLEESMQLLLDRLFYAANEVSHNHSLLIKNIKLFNDKKTLEANYTHNFQTQCSSNTVIDVFAQRVQQQPNEIAIEYKNTKYTYSQLNDISDRIAYYLIDQGVNPADNVVIYSSVNCPENIFMIFGIIKAGACYVVVDANSPESRLSYILDDSKAHYVFSDLDKQYIFHNFPVVLLSIKDAIQFECKEPFKLPLVSIEDTAYVLYTSGTTGYPKGVMVSHRGLINYVTWAGKTYFEDCKYRMPLFTSLCFDLTCTSIYVPLIFGGQVVVFYEGEINAFLVRRIASEAKVDVIKLTPTHLRLLEDMDLHSSHIKKIIVGGEDFPRDLADKIMKCFGSNKIEIYNEYGPTEATIGCMVHHYDRVKDTGDSVPIGAPIDNLDIYILDEHKQIIPSGIVGEIYIAGEGVAKGYISQEELTERSFVDDPFKPGQKMYKTGDLAKRMNNGLITFMGRKDNQIKIRGYRIEISEIEECLLRFDMVKQAAVISCEDYEDHITLHAFIEPDNTEYEPEVWEVREYLREQLPEYMIPAYIHLLDKIPVTTNGKIDRSYLRKMEINPLNEEDFIKPSTYEEKMIYKVWQEVLNLEEISIDANFFEVGGDSLKIMKLSSLIQSQYKVDIELVELFSHPTIEEMARLLHIAVPSSIQSIESAGEKEFYLASSSQKRMYILSSIDANSTIYNCPSVLEFDNIIDFNQLQKSVNALIERHEALRTSFHLVDGLIMQKITPAITLDIEYEELEDNLERNDNIERIFKKFLKPFKLDQCPLVRVKLIQIGDSSSVLMVDLHHIISDGVSISLLIKDLMSLYKDESLSRIKLMYKDFSEWQSHMIESGQLEKQKLYWENKLKNIEPVNFPTDYPRSANMKIEGKLLRVEIDELFTKKLKELASKNNVSLYMLLLSAFYVFIYKYTNKEDLIVGTVISGRNHPDLYNVVGVFINTLVMRNKLSGEISFLEFIQEVRRTAIEAYENQDFPFELLNDIIKLPKQGGRNSLFDVMFSLQNMEITELQLGEINSQDFIVDFNTTHLDLNFMMHEWKGCLILAVEFNTNLYKEITIRQMMKHYQRILDIIVGNSNILISDIDILSRPGQYQNK